jgi:hypothetical protein
MQVIYAREEKASKGKMPIEWFGNIVSETTSEPVTSIEGVYECIGYYAQFFLKLLF